MGKEIKVAVIGGAALIGVALITGFIQLSARNQPPVFSDLSANKPTPQFSGSSIRFEARADDPDGDVIRYHFRLTGPTSQSEVENVQNWSTQSTWEWNATQAGEYRIEARIRDGHHAGDDSHDDARVLRYVIASTETEPSGATPEGRIQGWIDRFVALRDRGEMAGALRAINQALELNPENEDALVKKTFVLHSLGRYEDSIQVADQILLVNPRSTTALNNKSSAAYSLGRYEEALQIIGQAIELVPDDAAALTNKCSILRLDAVGRYLEAIEWCDKSLAVDPKSAHTLNHKGSALYSLERYEASIEQYREAVRLDPDFTQAWYNLGTAYFMLERYTESIRYLDRALALDPTNDAADNVKRIAKEHLTE